MTMRTAQLVLLSVTLASLSACALEPRGAAGERQRLANAGNRFEQPYDHREIPPLPDEPDWRDVLQRAFLTHGDLEAAYFEWKTAVANVRSASAYPNTNLAVGYSYMFSKERMKSWNRTTLSVGFDPSMMLQLPQKAAKAGEVALAQAQAAGQRFRGVKFALQQRVISEYLDYALTAERLRLAEEDLALLKMTTESADQRLRAGGPQQDLLRAHADYEMARNELANMSAELSAQRARLNSLLGRSADAPLPPPATLPEPRNSAIPDHVLLDLAAHENPELEELAHQTAGRRDALELARLAYLPDFAPQFSITGDVAQVVGMMATLPTTLARIRGSIDEARAMLRSTQAMARQRNFDHAGQFVAALYALRNHERQATVLGDTILPLAQQVSAGARQAYAAGSLSFAELLESQRTQLEVRRVIAEVRVAREVRLAELETMAGVDLETILDGMPAHEHASLSPSPSESSSARERAGVRANFRGATP